MGNPEVSIIIVNWNVKEFLSRCLTSLQDNYCGKSYEVIVVDNASSDGSVEFLKSRFPGITFIENITNLGYPAGNNQGLEISKGKYKLLLNPDIIVRNGSIEKMLRFMEEHPRAGACGGALYGLDGKAQFYNRSFPGFLNMIFYHSSLKWRFPRNKYVRDYLLMDIDNIEVQEIDQPGGACLMLRGETLGQVGFMDERFFLFYNEVDLCCRIKKAGWAIYYLPFAEFDHVGKASWGKLKSGASYKYWEEGIDLYFRKHFSILHAKAFLFAIKLDRLISGENRDKDK